MNSRCLCGFFHIIRWQKLVRLLGAPNKCARLCTWTHWSLSWRVTISTDIVKEKWMERQKKEYNPLITQFWRQKQHTSHLSGYNEPCSYTEFKVQNSPGLVTKSTSRARDLYIVICLHSAWQRVVKITNSPKIQFFFFWAWIWLV